MLSEFSKHLVHYMSLGGIIIVSVWGILSFPYDQTFQSLVTIALATSFVIWGIIHHHVHGDLHPKAILEYIATAILGATALLVVIWRL